MEDKKQEYQIQRELNIRKIVIIIFIAITIITIIALISLYISQKNFRKWIDVNLFRKSVTARNVASIDLDIDKNNQIFCYDKYITILNNKNLKIFNSSGENIEEISIDINTAIFDSCDKYLAIAEKNGQQFYLIADKTCLWREKIDGEILQIHINKNGYIALVTTDTTYKSIINLYNQEGKQVFKYYLSTTRIEDLTISSDNKYLAFSELDISGALIQSNIKVLSTENAKKNSDDAIYNAYNCEVSKMIVKLKYQEKGQLLCAFDDSIDVIDQKNEKRLIDINKEITFTSVNLNNCIAYIEEETSGMFKFNSVLNIVNSQNNHKYTYNFDEIAKEMYTYGNIIGINVGTEIYFVNVNGMLIKEYISNQEITNVILSNQIAIAIYKDRIEIINL